MSSPLRPTFLPTHAQAWEQPGGAWDVGTLGALAPSGDHLAVVDGGSRFEGRQFEILVSDLAGRMLGAGIGRDQVVAWQLPNCTSSLLLYWACWRVGAIAAPLHRRLGPSEVTSALDQVSPAVVLAADGLPAADLHSTLVLSSRALPDELADLFAASANTSPTSSPAKGADIAAVLFTSGSSGVPKAVLHTHRGLAYKARLMAQVHGLRRGDPVLAPAPLAHVSGLLNGVLISAVVGGPCVLIDPWDPSEGLRLLEDERVAFVGAPPIFFSQMAELSSFSRERVSALRLISTGGASVSPAFVDSTSDAYGCRVKRTYGSTEAPTVTTSGPDDPYERARDTDGHAVGQAEIEVHDPESGRRLGGRPHRRDLDTRAGALRRVCESRADRNGRRRTRRLVPLGGSRIGGRRRLAPSFGPIVGHHHQGGREHLGLGGRSGTGGASLYSACGGGSGP